MSESVKIRRWSPNLKEEIDAAAAKEEQKALESALGRRLIREQQELVKSYEERDVSTKPVSRTFRSL